MSNENLQVDPLLMEFLDLDTYKDREEFLLKNQNDLNDMALDSMAMSLDLVLDDNNQLFGKAEQLLRCIRMQERYETNRFR